MNLSEVKQKLVSHLSQLIQIDNKGTLIASTDEIAEITTGVNMFNAIPFLGSLQEPLGKLNQRDRLSFKCVQSDYFGLGNYFDFTFFLQEDGGQDYILLLIEDYTEQYQKILELQQERNVETISQENAKIEALKKTPEAENIFIKVDSLLLNFDLRKIQYIEAYGDYIKVHTMDQFYVSYSKLKNIEELLSKKDFIRIHRSYIIRIDQIISLNQQKLQIKDTFLPISLSYKDDLLSRIKKLN